MTHKGVKNRNKGEQSWYVTKRRGLAEEEDLITLNQIYADSISTVKPELTTTFG